MILTSKKKSQISEKQAAKLYRGKTQIASGAISHSKGGCQNGAIPDRRQDHGQAIVLCHSKGVGQDCQGGIAGRKATPSPCNHLRENAHRL